MRGIVSFLQTLGGNVGIDLRRDEMRVAEQCLHAPQIRAGIQQVRRVTVPQFVRGQAGIESGDDEILFQTPGQLDRLQRRGLFRFRRKHRRFSGRRRLHVLQ